MDRNRPEPPLEGDDRTMLVGWLDFHRETLALRTKGLATTFSPRPSTTGGARPDEHGGACSSGHARTNGPGPMPALRGEPRRLTVHPGFD